MVADTLSSSTLLRTLRSVVEAMWLPGTNGKPSHRTNAWTLHLNFDVDHHVPVSWELTDARGKGAGDEKNVLRKRLQPDRTHVMDRYYARFTLRRNNRRRRSRSAGGLDPREKHSLEPGSTPMHPAYNRGAERDWSRPVFRSHCLSASNVCAGARADLPDAVGPGITSSGNEVAVSIRIRNNRQA